MPHARQTIREALAAAVTGLATTGSRVFQSRVYPLQPSDLPALVIYTQREPVAYMNRERLQRRTLEVMIDAYARVDGTVDDTLDTICLEVETALAADITLGGKLFDLVLADTTVQLSGEGDRAAGLARMRYVASYQTQEGAPGTAL